MVCSIIARATRSLWLLLLAQCLYCTTLRQTVSGPIEGTVMTTSFGGIFYVFRGIRYAKPPITGTDPLTGETVDRRFKV